MENNSNFRVNLKSLTFSELEEFIAGLAVEKYRAKQLATWIFKKGVTSFQEMTDLSKGLRERLETAAWISTPDIKAKLKSKRGDTVKYLFGLSDGQAVESVYMKHDYGSSACVSTQVGCRYACRLCASGLGGLVRDLDAGEIYDQALGIEKDSGERISHLVIMGSGEPLDNYRATLTFIKNIAAIYGLNIGYRHITISTCGLAPGIRRLAAERLPLTLAVSLHAPNDSLRDWLVPINKRHPLPELIAACRDYARETGRRITFEYALIAGVNDSREHAEELCGLLSGMLCHVNLIPANPVAERGIKPPAKKQVELFKSILEGNMLATTVRREFGADINAACGQLRRRILSES
ncbi:MAG: putative dual-specificity RNA methyltransferase RlmN [Firmicutes bacterium ADurb.Bin373]|nr:23S rRNA (adenine(2503)-C(2))-methyltransferase RlmN [Bacillota bacterium]OQA09907.1 MAG: putative dual-specificity RNA methyltransferase RlmN [Firmicutes bacterium ADurb.Bin373]